MQWVKNKKGFTIVELIIVIIIIAILATITIVVYTGVQQRARDTQRINDIDVISQALELYYLDNGKYPGTPADTGGSGSINSSWSTTADASWQRLVDVLKPYGTVGRDPISTPNKNVLAAPTSSAPAVYNYGYFSSATGYCGAAPFQMYILTYRLESGEIKNTIKGPCPSNGLLYGNSANPVSNYRVAR